MVADVQLGVGDGEAAPSPARPPALASGISFEQMAIGLLFVTFAVAAAFTPAQNDTFWHLRAGADIWRSGQVPRIDSYSHTMAGAAWPDHEWLSQALMYAAYRLGGMRGLEVGAAALILAMVATMNRLMVGSGLTRFVLLALGLTFSSYLWSLRPQILSLLLLVVLVWLLARDWVFLIPPLFLIWANAHGGVALGGAVLIAATATAIWRGLRVRAAADRRRAIAFAVVLPLSGLATALTPLGFGIFGFVIASTGRSYDAKIIEWYALRPDTALGATFWAVTLAFVMLVIRRRRALAAGSWADGVVVVAALALLPFAARSLRNIGPFLILATPAVGRLLGPQFRFRPKRHPRPPSADHPRVNLALLAVACLGAIVMVPLRWQTASGQLHWHPIDDEALRAVRGCDGPLYNQYNEGGTLIWFAPEKPVFIDGRQDPYPPAFLQQALAIERGAPYRAMFDRYRIGCAFLPAASKMSLRLRADGWRPRFLDGEWAVLAAPGAG